MRLIWSKEKTLSGLQAEVVEEEDTETPNVSRELAVEAEDKRALLGGETWGEEMCACLREEGGEVCVY